tara:strand:+ start:1301 stop:1780 length:480 start_codon:yes stop_codon:yes gene_type:complete
MKTILSIIALFSAIVAPNATIENIPYETYYSIDYQDVSIDTLLQSIILVESNGDSSAVGDKHMKTPSIGLLQIREVMVDEINRILKKQRSKVRYVYSDRWSATKSIEMYYIWKEFHHNDSDSEIIARNWNGGTYGYKKKSTIKYWTKVKSKLSKYEKSI